MWLICRPRLTSFYERRRFPLSFPLPLRIDFDFEFFFSCVSYHTFFFFEKYSGGFENFLPAVVYSRVCLFCCRPFCGQTVREEARASFYTFFLFSCQIIDNVPGTKYEGACVSSSNLQR
ncbi:unnamed protein product [Laminaria digitata]